MSSAKATRSNVASGTVTMDESAVEQIVNKLASKLIGRIEDRLDKLSKKFDSMETKINTVADKLVSIEKLNNMNQNAIGVIKRDVGQLSQLSKMNNLRITGVEEEDNENLSSKVLTLINKSLEVKCGLVELNNVFRLGKKVPGKSRVISLQFTSYIKRNEVYKSKSKLKGTGIFLNEDLSQKNYNLQVAAKGRYGAKNVWTQNCRIYVNDGNSVKRLNEEADLSSL